MQESATTSGITAILKAVRSLHMKYSANDMEAYRIYM